ncbi:MAG: hypothetical protein JKY25_01665 [Robiginitomaculum sp.]|nr:hypothetical protein [Robiginitomaculum sp.]
MFRISIFVSVFVTAFWGVATNSYGADQNTYRAGQAYLKTAAANHVQCEQQCRGDAGCRGWNFIRPNPGSRTGICEFNARKARAQSSPVSISGEINTGVDALLSQTVPTQGRTVRVGTPIVPSRQTPSRNLTAERPQIKLQNLARLRSPKPEVKQGVKHMPTPANHPAPHFFQQPQASPQTQITPANTETQSLANRQNLERQFYRQQMLAAQRRAAEQAYARNFGQRSEQQNYGPRPVRQYTPPQFQQGNYPPQPQAPQPQPQQNPVPVRMAPPPMKQMNRPQAYGPQPQSLYGSLHADMADLTKNMTPVPRPQTAPDFIDNPDAPLSTSRSLSRSLSRSGSRAAPTAPVETAPLERPTFAELAGGR